MTEPKDKPQRRRAPGPKSKRKVIPEAFKISRTVHPLRQILDEAEQISGKPEPSTSGKPDGNMASKIAIPLNHVASKIAIPLTTGLPENQISGKPVSSTTETSGKPQLQRQIAKYRRPNEVTYTSRMDAELFRKIKTYCAEAGVSLQEFWTDLASQFFENMASMLATGCVQPMASMLAHDDMMIFTTHDDIIMRYQHFTNQTWTRRDDREGKRYNNTDIRLLDIAFITTIERKLRGNTAKQAIRSFNYFTDEIDVLLAQVKENRLPGELDQYHRYTLGEWERWIRAKRDEKWKKEPNTKQPTLMETKPTQK